MQFSSNQISPEIALALTNCDREPIHIPSAIQPGGALVAALRSDLSIAYVSENSAELIGITPAEILRMTLPALLGREQMSAIEASLNAKQYTPGSIVSLTILRGGVRLDATVHEANGLICLELEAPPTESPGWEALSNEMQNMMSCLQRRETLRDLCDTAVEQVAHLTKYDRVMVYRFDENGDGEVVAERMAPGMEPFLGLHYPSTDIPVQARQIYLKQRVRAITSACYTPVRLLARADLAGGQPFDMTYCALRSVSPVHLEYMRNMGVAASFSISLIHEQRLWGLIACHHRSEKRPSPAVRALADLVGQLISLLIGVTGRADRYAEGLAAQSDIEALNKALADDRAIEKSLAENGDKLLRCVGADGACFQIGGNIVSVGATPGTEQAGTLISALQSRRNDGLFLSAELGKAFPEFQHLAQVASGALLVSLANRPNDAALWLRGEVAQSVRWGGDPNKAKQPSPETGLLSPRKSFAAWQEVQRGRCLAWTEGAVAAAQSVARLIEGAMLHRTESALAKLSHHDPLTGLPNRRLMLEELAAWQQSGDTAPAALLFLDVDNFKTVNDSLGHSLGDQLLIQVAQRIRQCTAGRHLVYRLGGDEFVVFCRHTAIGEARQLAAFLIESFAQHFVLDGKPFRTTISAGITSVGRGADGDLNDPLRSADSAMYISKQKGGNQVTVYEPPQRDRVLRQLRLEQALFQALDNDELAVHYQPQVQVATGDLIGFEALLRWNHPLYGSVAPAEFIPMAERLGLINPIGKWVLNQALLQVKQWRDRFDANLTMSVNVSVRQALSQDFSETVREALVSARVPGSALCLEVTESTLVRDQAITTIEQVRAFGVRISVDDFGTGYSSLAYLQNLPLDELKLDQSFLRGVGQDARKSALMGAIIHMAHTLDLNVIAEGVEQGAERDGLVDLLCDGAQGNLFSPAMAALDIERGGIFTWQNAAVKGNAEVGRIKNEYPAFMRLLATSVERAPDVVLITEADPIDGPGPRIIYVNAAFERMTGYRSEEVIGKTPRILQGPKTDRAALDRIHASLQKWQPVCEEMINYRKDGSEFYVHLSIFPICNASGWYTHWVSLQRDTTEQRRMMDELSAEVPAAVREAVLKRLSAKA